MPFGGAMLALAFGVGVQRIAARGLSLGAALEIVALALSVTVVAYDFLVTRGSLAGPHLGPIGMLGGVMLARARREPQRGTRLGGDIVVETAPGVGTMMTVRLPVALLATGDAAPEAGAESTNGRERPPIG